MHLINRAIADAFCCFTFQSHEELQKPAKLQKMPAKAHSPMTMSTPCTTLPTTYDSPDALQNILASSSSTRGYHAVKSMPPKHSTMQGSLDFDFRFGPESPKKKPSSRLEQLTSHVKNRLSESRLNKSYKNGNKPTSNQTKEMTICSLSSNDPVAESLGRSQGSTGLTELLASRTASEGGYDSDAHSIQSPMTLSTAGTLTIGPGFVRRSLATIEASQTDEPPQCLDSYEPTANNVLHSSQTTASKTSPLPTTPTKTPFIDACQVGPAESPKDVLRRLSEGITKGIIKMPATPELRAMCVTDADETDLGWRLPLSAPRRSSSLGKSGGSYDRRGRVDQDIDLSIKRLADYVSQSKRTSHSSSAPDSLVSQLDPTLLAYIERFANNKSCTETVSSSPITAVQVDTKPKEENIKSASHTALTNPNAVDHSRMEIASMTSSDAQSVHLFNMRISHRLASTSRVPMASSALHSNNDSSKSSVAPSPTDTKDKRRPSSSGRMPTFIAFEHTRRPSDPQTKKLFEQVRGPTRPRPTSIRSLSDGASAARPTEQPSGRAVIDDSSSYYGSVEGLSKSQNVSRSSTRSSSIKNVHSLAVGGRSASGPLLLQQGNDKSIGHLQDGLANSPVLTNSLDKPHKMQEILTTPQEASQLKRAIEMRKQSKYLKVDSTPTPVGRRFYDSTDANEDMSVIGIDGVLERSTSGANNLSSETQEELKNETFSDVNRSGDSLDAAAYSAGIRAAEGWLSQGRRQGWNYGFKDDTPIKRQSLSSIAMKEVGTRREETVEDSASEMWHRAFNRIGESEDHGRLLATPKFDTEGRRKSLTKIKSEGSQACDAIQRLTASPTHHRRSQSADLERPHFSDSSPELRSYRRKSVPVLSISGNRPLWKRKQLRTVKSKQKRSLGDLGRLVRKGASSDDRVKSRSLRSPFGIWGRFPSHTREQRNGPAGSGDDVEIHDFYRESTNTPPAQPASMQGRHSTVSFTANPQKSWKRMTLKEPGLRKGSTRSMDFALSTAERARRHRKGFAGKIRRLYRTKSSQLHAYATTKGHRSSLSMGSRAEYPELECLPGEGAVAAEHRTSESGLDGASERCDSLSLDTISEATSKRSRSMLNLTVPRSRRDAEEWSRLYQECVGSLSALRSENELRGNGEMGNRRILSLSSALRDSTVNFHAKLTQDTDRAKEELLKQLQTSKDSESEGLRMPGSFV